MSIHSDHVLKALSFTDSEIDSYMSEESLPKEIVQSEIGLEKDYGTSTIDLSPGKTTITPE